MVPPPVAGAPQQEPKSTRWRLEYPLQTILGAAFVLLLGFAFTQTNDRISRLDDRVSRLEDKVDAGFARIDERFSQQDAKFDERLTQQDAKFDERFSQQDAKFDAKFDEINLKLTALIAALNATAGVEAALGGNLLDPNALSADEPPPQPS